MDYNHISNLLKKQQSLVSNRDLEMNLIILIIKKHIDINLKLESVILKNNQITIKGSAALRSEIFLRKKEILEDFKQNNLKIRMIS